MLRNVADVRRRHDAGADVGGFTDTTSATVVFDFSVVTCCVADGDGHLGDVLVKVRAGEGKSSGIWRFVEPCAGQD